MNIYQTTQKVMENQMKMLSRELVILRVKGRKQ